MFRRLPSVFKKNHNEGFYKKEDILELYSIQDHECYFCSATLLEPNEKHPFEIDHLIPVSRGGTDWPGNLALVCKDCNQKKSKHPTTYLWDILKNEKGDSWVKDKVKSNKNVSAKRAKLTKLRKAEREETLLMLEIYVEEAIRNHIDSSGLDMPNHIDIEIYQDRYWLVIEFNAISLSIPAPTHKKLLSYKAPECKTIASSLVGLGVLFGYIKQA